MTTVQATIAGLLALPYSIVSVVCRDQLGVYAITSVEHMFPAGLMLHINAGNWKVMSGGNIVRRHHPVSCSPGRPLQYSP